MRGLMIGLGVFGLTTGCSSTSGLELEMSRLRREMAAVKNNMVETQRKLERLEGRVTLLSLGDEVERRPNRPLARTTAPTPSPKKRSARGTYGEQRVLPVVRLGSNAQAAPETEEWQDPGALDDGSPPVMIKLGPSEDAPPRLKVDHAVLKKPDPVLDSKKKTRGAQKASREEIRQKYKSALVALRERRAPQEALEMFREFLEAHPRSRLADNASYWAGECLYTLTRYEEAIQQFDMLLARHPQSPKVPHGLVRKGESWMALGLKGKATEVFEQVINDYPTSEAAQRAQARLDNEGGK